MSEKVKVTQGQAESIKLWVDKTQLLKAKIVGLLNHGEDEPIAEMDVETLAKALYIGYEVEPEFKLNEWIYNIHNGKIFQMRKDDLEPANKPYNKKHLRHATPSEIAEEKERRFWERHGRDVWSVEDGDIVRRKSDGFCFDVAFYSPEHFKENSELYEIACFWEDRLDVKTNE